MLRLGSSSQAGRSASRSLLGMIYFSKKMADSRAFTSSCVYLIAMLVGAAIGLYPRLLPSSSNPADDITIARAISRPHTLRVGLAWWALKAAATATDYFAAGT